MTLFVEFSRPWQWMPGKFRSRLMTRAWWGFLAVAWLHVPFHEYAIVEKEWRWED